MPKADQPRLWDDQLLVMPISSWVRLPYLLVSNLHISQIKNRQMEFLDIRHI